MEWTEEDSHNAQKQGWCVFYCIGSDRGKHQLQRIDEPEEGEPIFNGDEQAWEFVYQQFLTGDKLAVKAFYFLAEHCMEEFQRIKKHGENTITKNSLYNSV